MKLQEAEAWHRQTMTHLAVLSSVDPKHYFSASAEAGSTWLLAIADGMRSAIAVCSAEA